MNNYEKAVALWKRRNITNDAELAEALNGHSIAFAYHSGKIENDRITYNDTREIFDHDGQIMIGVHETGTRHNAVSIAIGIAAKSEVEIVFHVDERSHGIG